MPYSVRILRELDELDPKLKSVFLAILEEIEKNVKETVKKSDFEELKQIVAKLSESVAELAQAQKAGEARLTRLEAAVKELAEAQKRTEQRVEELAEAQKASEARITRLEKAVEELAEAQKRTEQRVEELAEAQKRTEQRVEELAEAQKRTEQRLEELAQAQKRTEEELKKLIKEHATTRELLGNLQDTVGYGLEDKIIPYIPSFAKKVYDIEVTLIDRRNVIYPDGRYDEVNIYAEGLKDNQKVYLIGECKSKPGKKNIDKFVSVLNRLKNHLNAPIYPFVVGYTFSPEVERYLKEKYPQINLLKSFEFELKYSK